MQRSTFVRALNPRFRSGRYRLSGLVAVAAGSIIGCSDSHSPAAPSGPGTDLPAPTAVADVARSPIQTNQFGAAIFCPASTLGNVNLATNPSFEFGIGPQAFPPGSPTKPSAATGWDMHTSNTLAPVRTARVALPFPGVPNPPGPSQSVGKRMLHITSGSVEGGVTQTIFGSPARVMFSIWVYVRKGRVFLELNSNGNPGAWTTKQNEWEQIRACTDGSVSGGYYALLNEDINGGDFFIDRAEIREILVP